MKIIGKKNIETNIDSNKEQAFKITTNGRALSLLTSNIYQRVIPSIIREIASNAMDAHFQAGKRETAISITTPTFINPFFEVEDFGVGLSPEQMMDLYANFFASNKRDTNEMIGGHGLGSKSPFAYADSFNIRSRYNGKEYQYIAMKSNKGLSLTLISEKDTSEQNGIKVSIPVMQHDYEDFSVERVKKGLFWFDIPIMINNEEYVMYADMNRLDLIRQLNESGFITAFPYDSELSYLNVVNDSAYITIVVGGNAYPVSRRDAMYFSTYIGSDVYAGYINENKLIIKGNVGDFDFGAGREYFSDDEYTQKNIKNTMLNAYKKFYETVKTGILSYPSFFDGYSAMSEQNLVSDDFKSAKMWATAFFNEDVCSDIQVFRKTMEKFSQTIDKFEGSFYKEDLVKYVKAIFNNKMNNALFITESNSMLNSKKVYTKQRYFNEVKKGIDENYIFVISESAVDFVKFLLGKNVQFLSYKQLQANMRKNNIKTTKNVKRADNIVYIDKNTTIDLLDYDLNDVYVIHAKDADKSLINHLVKSMPIFGKKELYLYSIRDMEKAQKLGFQTIDNYKIWIQDENQINTIKSIIGESNQMSLSWIVNAINQLDLSKTNFNDEFKEYLQNWQQEKNKGYYYSDFCSMFEQLPEYDILSDIYMIKNIHREFDKKYQPIDYIFNVYEYLNVKTDVLLADAYSKIQKSFVQSINTPKKEQIFMLIFQDSQGSFDYQEKRKQYLLNKLMEN